jgi:hypothetical protein
VEWGVAFILCAGPNLRPRLLSKENSPDCRPWRSGFLDAGDKPMRWFRIAITVLLLASGMLAAHAATDRIVTIERTGYSPLLYLATVPDGEKPKGGALVFVGGDGVLDLAGQGIPQPGNSFLLLARRVFAEHGLAIAVFDPSTESGPLSDQNRMSQAHAQEARLVLQDFRDRFNLGRITLIGASRGTISAAHLALRFPQDINGVVLAATVFVGSRTGPGLEGFDYGQIDVPLLFLHHRYDACSVTPPSGAESMRDRYAVIFLEGGQEKGEPCGPFSPHGFLGQESEAVAAISAWILQQAGLFHAPGNEGEARRRLSCAN